jgi:hypothetical protein
MGTKGPSNPFQEVHNNVQEPCAFTRELHENGAVIHQRKLVEEAVREGFDRA